VTSAGAANSSEAIDTLAVRQLETIGEGRFHGGISYTFAVCPSGRVFEGHGIDRRGAHTGGDNTYSRAIVLIGNYDVARPSTSMLESVAELLVEGVLRGWWGSPTLTGGHRDAPNASTACPGRNAYATIPGINLAAGRLYAARLARPQPEGPDLTPDESRMLREIHEQNRTAHDYRAHHDAPDDVQYGHVLATRHELHELVGGLAVQIAALTGSVGQVLRQVTPPPAGRAGSGG
jgi:hypothetical protein